MLADHTKEEVRRLLLEDKKLKAIQYVGTTHKVSLRDAVRLVELVEQEVFPGVKPRRLSSGLPSIFYWAFGGVGTLLIGIAAYLFYSDQQSIRHYVPVDGVVIENRIDHEGMASPTIQYNWNGQDMLYYSLTSTNPPAFDKGEQVQVYVNPEDPTEIIVDSFVERFLAVVILGGIGAAFLGFTFLFAKIFS